VIPFTSELKASSGDLTIPADTRMVVALVAGTTNPTLGGAAMSQECANGVSISTMENPPTGTVACTISQATRFIYINVAAAIRSSIAKEEKPFSEDIVSSPTDLILGIAAPDVTGMTVDAGAMSYLDNFFRGYKDSADFLATCGASGSGFTLFGAFVSIRKKGFVKRSRWI